MPGKVCEIVHDSIQYDNLLKILHVYKDYHPILGGIENHIKTVAEAQAAAGHDVTVLVTNPGREPKRSTINGVQLIRAWQPLTVASTPLSPELPLLLARQRPDITHLHFPYPIGELGQLLFGRARPFVITYHSDVVKQQSILRFYRPFLNRILAKADRILPTSGQYIASSDVLAPHAGKCTVVPLSVDPAPFQGPEPLVPRQPHQPTILFVGRHRYYKGVDTLIRGMKRIDARLLVGGDGPMRPGWESLARELDLSDKVLFTGQVSDEQLPSLYASADLFVLPANARAEAFGKVLLEAMATGLPCVTTELGTGTSFVVQDGITGLVVPPRDPDALSAAVNRLLADESLRLKMGSAGRARVMQEFTPRKLLERIMAVYEQVLADHR